MKLLCFIAVLVCTLCTLHCQAVNGPCTMDPLKSTPFCDYTLTLEKRVKDLVDRLTIPEKISLLGTTSPGVPRLNIPPYEWWNEALHGIADSPGVKFQGKTSTATSFPQVMGLSQTLNRTLIHRIAQSISTEARAFSNQGNAGFTFFTPNINIFRDPRWGRGQETPGEDPYLNGEYAYLYATGFQEGEDPRYLKNVVNCKHYAAYSLEEWNGIDRHHFDAVVSSQDFAETYLPAFESCANRGRAASIMCSYNAVNGVPSCANEFLLDTMLRKSFNFNGFVVSDCGAIDDIYYTHKYASTVQDTCKVALNAGCDLDCGHFYQTNLQYAVGNKTVDETMLDRALTHLYLVRLRLGEYDPPEIQPYRKITPSSINTPEHQRLAYQAARESIVLLKNENNILPFNRDKVRSVALIGPNANATVTMKGNYYGFPPFIISPIEGFERIGIKTVFSKGCDINSKDTSGFNDAVGAAKSADAVVLIMGIDQSIEAEGRDRYDISLPGVQWDLVKLVQKSIAGSGKPLILVLMAGGSLDLTYAKQTIDSILWTGYPGQFGGLAIADVVFGNYNPSGRLVNTLYEADYVNQISFYDMNMRPKSDGSTPGRTYRFYVGSPVYPFGHGLSYTTFSFKLSTNGEAPLLTTNNKKSVSPSTIVSNYKVTVTNTGKLDGEVSVLITWMPDQKGDFPLKQVFGYDKVHLKVGESKDMFFTLFASSIASVTKEGRKVLREGNYKVFVMDQQFDMTSAAVLNIPFTSTITQQ